MNKKKLLLATAAMIVLTANTWAQNVPSYVPADGLVGWWPFNGNANDESGNGNDGTVNGALLSSDRFSSLNAAYHLDGNGDNIYVPNNFFDNGSPGYSIAIWYNLDQLANPNNENSSHTLFNTSPHNGMGFSLNWGNSSKYAFSLGNGTPATGWNTSIFNAQSIQNIVLNSWKHVVVVKSGNTYSLYIDGVFDISWTSNTTISSYFYQMYFGATVPFNANEVIIGSIDDIGIWNRALTPQEIAGLYNSIECISNTTISPSTNSFAIGSTATFSATSSDPNPSFIWQSDLGQGFQSLNDYGQYSGVNSGDLSISNVQLSEHLQQVRAISTSGNCIDTSNVAVVNILDTCITNISVYDTLFTSVTDTLVINTQITGINPLDIQNTIKVFPNPTSTHITIDYGNYSAMSGYALRITNSLGAEVFNTSINQQTSYIDLGSWSGNGLYFVHIIDPQGNTIDIRKIVLQ